MELKLFKKFCTGMVLHCASFGVGTMGMVLGCAFIFESQKSVARSLKAGSGWLMVLAS